MRGQQVNVLKEMDRVFRRVQDPLFLIDEIGRCFYGNPAVLDFLGYTITELKALSIWEISETFLEKDWNDRWKKIRENGYGEMLDVHRKKNGQLVDVVITATLLNEQVDPYLYVVLREKNELKSMLGYGENSMGSDYNVFKHLEEGVAVHQIILDDQKNPVDYRFLEVNQSFCSLLGLKREDVIGKTVKEILPATPLSLIKEYGDVAVNRQAKNFIHYGEDLNKHWKIHAYSPAIMKFITIFSDVTIMVKKQRNLEIERERLKMAIDTADLAFLDIEMDEDRVHAEGRIFNGCKIMNIDDFDSFFSDIHPADQGEIAEKRRKLLDGQLEAFSIEMRLRLEGIERWIEMSLKNVAYDKDGKAKRIIGVIRDIDEKKMERQRVEFLAHHDILTGTYNRNAFERYIRSNLPEEQYPVGILLFDVDGLKLLNDGFGHGEGDLLLTTFAASLKSEFETPTKIFRIGGDEFAVIIPNVEVDEISERQKKIRKKVGAFDLPIQASVSSGFGVIESKGKRLAESYQKAEDQMYRNKLWEKRKERDSMSATLIESLDSRTHENFDHFTRIQDMVIKMADAMSLNDQDKMALKKLAYAHDIGKLATPKEILYKPDTLNKEEWDIMQKHSEIGYRIASGLNDLALVANDILLHHEHWDGTGYPHGLKGDEIPLTARLIGIIEAFDAMTHDRCYREKWSREEAIEILRQESGSKFDPKLIDIFLSIL
ncbi:diguanylate cyclase [Gottschalkiaceae bacterium SANA]|nr:diguanylate cyclase [Gottschalkiaceae bacterium SANA]